MKKIRTGVFETNSSSCHSLSIDDTDILLDYLIPNEYGEVTIEPGEFGWQWEKFNDAATKASYCLTGTQYVFHKDEKLALSNLREVIQEHTLCNQVNLIIPNDDYKSKSYGYIDHQSAEDGEMDDLLFDKTKLHNFIFNKKSWLFLGNDNSSPPNKFYDTEKLDYKYKLVINRYPDITWEFVDKPSKEEIEEALKDMSDIFYEKVFRGYYGWHLNYKSITNYSFTYEENWSSRYLSKTFTYKIEEI